MGYFTAVSILASSVLASGGCVSPEPERDPAPAGDPAPFSLSSALFDRLITHDSVALSVEGTVASISSRWGPARTATS